MISKRVEIEAILKAVADDAHAIKRLVRQLPSGTRQQQRRWRKEIKVRGDRLEQYNVQLIDLTERRAA